jgi:hypothetical protein
MTVEEWAPVASVVLSGLWSGLLAMLTLRSGRHPDRTRAVHVQTRRRWRRLPLRS